MVSDTERAIAALYAIPNDLSGDDWLRPSIGAKAAGIDFDTWHAWCQGAPNYKGESDCRARWKSFDQNGPIQAGTLYKAAAEHGWRINGKTTHKPAPERIYKPVEPPRKPAPGMSAAEVWSRCQPATSQHQYALAKGASGEALNGLRVVPDGDQLRVMGESMAGALVVPCMAADGTLSTLQFITVGEVAKRLKSKISTNKVNLPMCSVEGWFTVGQIKPGKPTYIVEGIGQAWACWQATGTAAVVAFGAGNMGKVATALRQREPTARLVICPDRGKEDDAHQIAAEVGAAVACLPESEPTNFDVNDLFIRDGFDVLAALLESATEPPKPKAHPLARFVDFGDVPKPPRWVIPGFIADGVSVISGSPGVGKTTALLPLALTAAGLHGHEDLMPRHWRHVIYATEDIDQAKRIIAGIVGHGGLNIDIAAVRERLHLVEAVRLDAQFVATAGDTYREQFTRIVDGVEVLPLVVLDTKSAVIALENENDNSEASRMMACLKQGFARLPVWLVGHLAKANMGRPDVPALSNRGAGATDADGNATLFLIQEGDVRYLVLGKKRFEPKWPELEIVSNSASTVVLDEFGFPENLTMRWGISAPAQTSRKEASEQAAERQRKEDETTLRQDIRDAVELAWVTGNPLNRAGVMAKLSRKRQTVSAMIENLLSEQWIYEVAVPAKVRVMNCKSAFLVNFTTEEHEAVLGGTGLPAAKLVIPASWQKQAVSHVPAPESESLEVDDADQ